MKAETIAEYLLYKAWSDENELITNLKLQKLLYYCQGFHLAFNDSPLFLENIQKWTHGPVVPSVYRAYSSYGNNPIDPPQGFDENQIPDESRIVINDVYRYYGRFTASGLRNLSHDEPPWKDADDAGVITHKSLKDYFDTRIY